MIVDLVQNTPEWLEFRRSCIGSSDAPIIAGDSPWKTPFQLWQQKLGLAEEQVQSFAMTRGKILEDRARQVYEEMRGHVVYPMVINHPEHSWQIASLDGITLDKTHAVEIKCPGKEDHSSAVSGIIPKKYYAQLQHQMYVCSLPSIDYFSFNGETGVIIEVERDIKYIQDLVKKEREFYFCMMNKNSPKLTERDYIPRNDEKYNAAAKRWSECKQSLDAASNEEEKARKELIDISAGQNTVGQGIKIQRLIRKGPIMYENIPELKLVDTEKYRKDAVIFFKIVQEENKLLSSTL
jgi:putative phage-type endonuclease